MRYFTPSGPVAKIPRSLKLIIVGGAITLVFAALQISQPLLVKLLNGKIYDVALHAVHDSKTSGVPVVVDIDEKSLSELGQWPWPRYRIAILLEKLKALGVSAVGIDFLFAETDRSSPRSIQSGLKKDFNLEVSFTGLPEALYDYDHILADTLKTGPFVLGYKFFDGSADENDCILHPVNLAWLDSSASRNTADFPESQTVLCNNDALARKALFAGFFNAAPDRDGVYRRVPLIVKHRDAYHASLALATFLMSRDTNQVVVVRDKQGLDAIRAAGISIPVDTFGNMLVHYRGAGQTFATISATDVYHDRASAEDLAGKIAFLGTSAAGLLDIRTTPLDPAFPGVEVQANVVDNIITGDFFQRPYWMPGAELLVLLGVALCTILSLVYAKPAYGLALVSFEMTILVAAAGYILKTHGLFFSPLIPFIACVALFSILTLMKFRTAEADKAFLHNAFSKFVSGDVVRELVAQPDQLTLSGEERQLTILFSDIRGFTSMSETLSPQQIGLLLNDYFTPMTAVIKEHGGTLDKYIGDAIMAFWNAPLKIEGHEVRAVRACIAMISEMGRLRRQLQESYGVVLNMGIGLHCGQAMVGNMGSFDLFNYTALGDSVNLASRVEGLTKKYGLPLLVTDSVVRGCGDEAGFFFWEIDQVMVVGKQEPVSIFYPVEGAAYATLRHEIDGYEQAYRLYKNRDFVRAKERFEDLAELSSFPELHRVFVDRCAAYQAAPPPAHWSGIHKLGSK